MKLELSLSQREFQQFSYGYALSGNVWEDVGMTVPHDLTVYDEVRFRIFKKDENTNRVNAKVAVANVAGDENKWLYIISQSDFSEDGIFNANLSLHNQGVRIVTLPFEILVERSGSVN